MSIPHRYSQLPKDWRTGLRLWQSGLNDLNSLQSRTDCDTLLFLQGIGRDLGQSRHAVVHGDIPEQRVGQRLWPSGELHARHRHRETAGNDNSERVSMVYLTDNAMKSRHSLKSPEEATTNCLK